METSGPDGTVSMTIRNSGKEADKLVGVSASPEHAELAKLQKAG